MLIDLHCHILPGLDDGARNLEQAVAMAEAAVADGIGIVAATPHHNNGRYSNDKTNLVEQVSLLNKVLTDRNIQLKVVGGQELRVNDQLWQEVECGNVLTLNESRYLLIELPSSSVPSGCEELIHELTIAGYVPIIAHPERNREIASNPARLSKLINMGALSQVTAGSITGDFGRQVGKLSLELCRGGLVHIVASDAHDNDRRKFSIGAAYQYIRDQLGEEYEVWLRGNAEKVVQDQAIATSEAIVMKRRRKLFFWK